MLYAYNFPGEEEKLDLLNIQRSAGATANAANAAYREKYGCDKHGDPDWVIGGERHDFWLTAFDDRWKSLILNPHQD